MRRVIGLVFSVVMLLTMVTPVMAAELTDEARHGTKMTSVTFGSDYIGEIKIDGVYVYSHEEDYIFTVKYSGGVLRRYESEGVDYVQSSFFSPPDGAILQISWINNIERISDGDGYVRYRAPKEAIDLCKTITIFLYDDEVIDDDTESEKIMHEIKLKSTDLTKVPTKIDLLNGVELVAKEQVVEHKSAPSEWAVKEVEELALTELIKASMFERYQDGITRADFVYLMVELYEKLTEVNISIDSTIQFTDTDDVNAQKAATLGITNGVGDGMFGPDIILNREQMTTFVIRTLDKAGIDLAVEKQIGTFEDDEVFKDWSRDSIYAACNNEILNGVGNNEFAPEALATNEQALIMVRRLLGKYDGLKWLNAIDADRLYFQRKGKLYQTVLDGGVILDLDDVESGELYFEELEDLALFLNLNKTQTLITDANANPNIEGIIVQPTFGKQVEVDVVKTYRGVDITGEATTYTFIGRNSTEKVEAKVISNTEGKIMTQKGLTEVGYYDVEGVRMQLEAFSVKEIFEALEIDYSLEYREDWDVYILTMEY